MCMWYVDRNGDRSVGELSLAGRASQAVEGCGGVVRGICWGGGKHSWAPCSLSPAASMAKPVSTLRVI